MITVPTPDLAIVLTTWPADRDPSALARPLIDEGLAACVNALPPMVSTYRWQGAVQVGQEQQLVIKTTRDRLGALHARLVSVHPYEVPEFLVLDVAGAAPSYAEWVRGGA
jgi:periplasmic divalent cation tolerance protein